MPKSKGGEEGLVVRYENNKKRFFKVTEAMSDWHGRKVKRMEIAMFRLLGADIAIQPEYDEDKNIIPRERFDVFYSDAPGDKCQDLSDYLGSTRYPEVPNGLAEILAKSLIHGIGDIRADNIGVAEFGDKKRAMVIDFFIGDDFWWKISLAKIFPIVRDIKRQKKDGIVLLDESGRQQMTLFKKSNNYCQNIMDLFIYQQSVNLRGKRTVRPSVIYDRGMMNMIRKISLQDSDGTMIKGLFEKATQELLDKFKRLKSLGDTSSLSYTLIKESMNNIIKLNEIASECFGSPLINEELLVNSYKSLSTNGQLKNEELAKIRGIYSIQKPEVITTRETHLKKQEERARQALKKKQDQERQQQDLANKMVEDNLKVRPAIFPANMPRMSRLQRKPQVLPAARKAIPVQPARNQNLQARPVEAKKAIPISNVSFLEPRHNAPQARIINNPPRNEVKKLALEREKLARQRNIQIAQKRRADVENKRRDIGRPVQANQANRLGQNDFILRRQKELEERARQRRELAQERIAKRIGDKPRFRC